MYWSGICKSPSISKLFLRKMWSKHVTHYLFKVPNSGNTYWKLVHIYVGFWNCPSITWKLDQIYCHNTDNASLKNLSSSIKIQLALKLFVKYSKWNCEFSHTPLCGGHTCSKTMVLKQWSVSQCKKGFNIGMCLISRRLSQGWSLFIEYERPFPTSMIQDGSFARLKASISY
jgi:hypothetical protein